MKAHHLGFLIAVAVITLVVGLWASKLQEAATDGTGSPLVPGLAEAVNDVTGVKLVGPGNTVLATLTRDDETWRLAEKAGHQANIPGIRELLLKLSRAKLLEEKTSNPDYYQRLGIENIDMENAGGVLVEIEGLDVVPVIIGNVENTREAVYARRADEATSWLVSGNIDIAKDVLQWVELSVVDVNASRIAEVEIAHPDGEVVLMSKSEFGQPNYQVASIPEGRELKRANIANNLASVISGLEAEDVMPLADSGFAEMSTTRVAYRAFDGFVLYVDVASKDDKYYAQFSAGTDPATAARYLTSNETDNDEATAPVETGPVQLAKPDLSVVAEEAVQQNKALTGWVYLLPKSKYDQMTRRLKDLLKDPA